MSRPSFSTGERGEACAASHALPRVLSSGEPAEIGKDIHDYLRMVAPDPSSKSRALARLTPELRSRCAAIDVPTALDGLEHVETETAYALDLESGKVRFLGKDLARKYPPLAPTEIAGALDVEARHVRRRLPIAVDWKTGRGEVTPPADNMQVGIQAFVRARMMGADEAIGRLAFIDEEGNVESVEHKFNALDLENVFERWRDTARRIKEAEALVARGEMPTVRMTPLCGYCPARPHCPAIVGFAKAMVGDLEEMKLGLEMMTADRMGEAWYKAKLAAKLAEEVVDALKLVAADMVLPLPDGKEVRAIPMPGKLGFSKENAIAQLRERGAGDEDIDRLMVRGAAFSSFRACNPPGYKAPKKTKTKAA